MLNQKSFLHSAYPDVVIVHGLMESGKSTLAGHLMENYGYVREKFADPLKNMVRVLLAMRGIPKEMIERYVEGDLKKAVIPELNDPARPENRLENLGPEGIRPLLTSLLFDCGMTQDEIKDHLYGSRWDKPIAQMENVTTAKRLFETLLHSWSKEMLAGEVVITRRLMQTLGEEWRNLHSNRLWAKITKAKTELRLKNRERVIIDDNRYKFEFQEFAELLPLRLVITRGNKHFEPISPDTHAGERPMPVTWFDHWFKNDGSTDALWAEADRVIKMRSEYNMSLRLLAGKRHASPIAEPQFDVV